MAGYKFAPNPWMVDHLPQIYMGMGLTAEEVQRKYGISREDADQFAYRSHQNALRAQAEGKFDEEIVPVEIEITVLDNGRQRLGIRYSKKTKARAPIHRSKRSPNSSPSSTPTAAVTAGNSSQTSDGAAAALVMSEKKAQELGLKPMARFVSFAVGGVPPEIMGIGPVVAIPKALALAGLKLTTSA